jgi:acyl carrier protein
LDIDYLDYFKLKINKMKEKLINVLAEALEMETDDIMLGDKFREYENYDSLTELSVFAMLDEEFGIELEMKEYKQYVTVNDLIKLVESKAVN